MTRTDPRQRITRVVEAWFLSEPLLFAAWTMHETVAQPKIATIRVGRGKIEFNPEFISSLNNQNLRQVLTFETMRILLGHPYLRRQADAQLSYAASNLSVQECLLTNLPIPRAREVLASETHDHQYFEYYYRELFERHKSQVPPADQEDTSGPHEDQPNADDGDQQPALNEAPEQSGEPSEDQAGDPTNAPDEQAAEENETNDDESDETDQVPDESGTADQPQGPGSDLESYTDAESTGLENTQSWDSDDLLHEELSIAIQEAAQGQGWGTLGGFAQEQLKATLRPPLDYRGVLRQFRQSVLAVNRTLTRMKPSRRYGFDQMGSRYDFTTSLLFAVDVSGSMNREDLEIGFSIVNQFFRYGVQGTDVLTFDTQILSPPTTLRRAKREIKLTGRGGTNFECLVDFIDGKSQWLPRCNYDGLVVFTDGVAPVPRPSKNRYTKFLWLFHTEDAFMKQSESLGKLGATAFVKPLVSRG